MTRKERASIILKELKKLFPDAKMALRYSNHHELLFAVMLSAQTTDKMVNKITPILYKKYKTLNSYIKAPQKDIEKIIKPIGLYKGKAKNIKGAAKMLNRDFNGKLPDSITELIKLPGVGRKTANVVLGNAHGKAEGIAVDTHVARLSKKFGLTKYKDPKKIEKDLMKIIPKKHWFGFTYLMIEYGRNYSPARKVRDKSDPISQKLK